MMILILSIVQKYFFDFSEFSIDINDHVIIFTAVLPNRERRMAYGGHIKGCCGTGRSVGEYRVSGFEGQAGDQTQNKGTGQGGCRGSGIPSQPERPQSGAAADQHDRRCRHGNRQPCPDGILRTAPQPGCPERLPSAGHFA